MVLKCNSPLFLSLGHCVCHSFTQIPPSLRLYENMTEKYRMIFFFYTEAEVTLVWSVCLWQRFFCYILITVHYLTISCLLLG